MDMDIKFEKKENSENLKDKKVLVSDLGNFIFVAEKLAESFGKVFYYLPNYEICPTINKSLVGRGLKNVIPITDMFLKDDKIGYDIDEMDMICFPFVYDIGKQMYFAKQGKNVFGAKEGQYLELWRGSTKELLKSLDIPVGEYESFTKFSDLREHLKKVTDKWVKISYWRGQFESFKHEEYKLTEPQLNAIERDLGGAKYIDDKKFLEYIVETPLKTKNDIEIGADTYVVNGEYPKEICYGLEVKEKAYIGTHCPYEELHISMKESLEKLRPVFKEFNYQGAFSQEIRMGEDGKNYPLDLTNRMPSPNTESRTEWEENFAENIWNVANGIVPEVKFKTKYALQVAFYSNWAKEEEQTVYFPEKYRENIKILNHWKIDDVDYITPIDKTTHLGYIVTYDDTIEGCIEKSKKICEEVKGYDLEIQESAFDEVLEKVKNVKKEGINF